MPPFGVDVIVRYPNIEIEAPSTMADYPPNHIEKRSKDHHAFAQFSVAMLKAIGNIVLFHFTPPGFLSSSRQLRRRRFYDHTAATHRLSKAAPAASA